MRDFFGELFDLCSASNKSSRGFYLIVTTALFVFAILSIVMPAMLIVSISKGAELSVFNYAFSALPVIVTIGIVVWLKKS